MILIWKGRGWLVPVLALASVGVSMSCADSFVTMTNYQNDTAIQLGIAAIYAGVFIRTFFAIFPAKPPRRFIDAETGRDVFVKPVDALYGIDVKYWAYGLLGIGLVLFGVAFCTALL